MGLIRREEVGEGDRQKENVIGAFNNRAAVAAARLQLGGFRLPYCFAICGQLGERERAPLKIHSAFLLLNLWHNINSSPIPSAYCVAQRRKEGRVLG